MKEFICDNDCSRCRYGSMVIKVSRSRYNFLRNISDYKCLLKSVSKSTLQEKFKFKTKFKI